MNTFIDFYQVLQVDPAADHQALENQFMTLGKKYHPDVPGTGNPEKFELLTQAFKTLASPEARKKYDELYDQQNGKIEDSEVPEDARMENINLGKEAADRVELMKRFYERRRSDSRNPGLAFGSLEGVVECSSCMLDFHLWYFQKKNWLFREEGGSLTITADGVDYVESGINQSMNR